MHADMTGQQRETAEGSRLLSFASAGAAPRRPGPPIAAPCSHPASHPDGLDGETAGEAWPRAGGPHKTQASREGWWEGRLPHFSQCGLSRRPSSSAPSGFSTTSKGPEGEIGLTSYEQEHREQPGQGEPGKSMPRRAEKPKPPRNAGGQQAVERAGPTEARGAWGPDPKASLLLKLDRSPRESRASEEVRTTHQLLPGTPSCVTPHHATGPVFRPASPALGVSKTRPVGYRAPAAQRPPPASQYCWQRQPHWAGWSTSWCHFSS